MPHPKQKKIVTCLLVLRHVVSLCSPAGGPDGHFPSKIEEGLGPVLARSRGMIYLYVCLSLKRTWAGCQGLFRCPYSTVRQRAGPWGERAAKEPPLRPHTVRALIQVTLWSEQGPFKRADRAVALS